MIPGTGRKAAIAATRTALNATAKKFMRAKAELKRRKAGYSALIR
jgi:hypothetical protein